MASKSDVAGHFERLSQLQTEAEEKCKMWQKSLHDYQTALLKLSDVAREASEQVGDVPEVTTLKRGPGRPKATTAKRGPGRPPKAEGEKRGPGRPPKAEKAEGAKRSPGRPPKAEKAVSAEKDHDNSPSLKRVVWDMLSKGSFYMKKHLPEYPAGAKGLKVSELKEIIEKSESWTTSSENIAGQIQNALYFLREAKKIDRNDEDRRYFIIKDAEYDG
jgi:hypothetical protein